MSRPKPREWFRMSAVDTPQAEPTKAEIHVYDEIGGWFGINASDFVQALAGLDVDEITMYVNSPGGDLFDAIAMKSALQRHRATVTASVDGLAASAATIALLGADTVIMQPGSELMIHEPSTIEWGDASAMTAAADRLDKAAGEMAALYAKKAGGTTADWRDAMLAETWYTAEEAVTAGLADLVGGEPVSAEAFAKHEPIMASLGYAHHRREEAPDPRVAAVAAHIPPARPDGSTPTESESNMDELIKGLRERLGVDAEVDEAGILAALDDALKPKQPEPTPGTVTLDEAAFADLQAQAAEGREARRQQIDAERHAKVDAAIKAGKIPPARKEAWLKMLEADPGAEATLASLPDNTIPVKESGFTGGVDEASDEDRLYSKLYQVEKEA